MAWKPRRLRKEDVQARVAHLQKNLPSVVHEVFAADGGRVGADVKPAAHDAKPATPKKKSKFAVLLWEPRGS